MIVLSLFKKRFLILFIGLISLLILEFQYFNLYFHTPKDSIYLGTVHYPPDYFSYLSFIAQGKDHFLSSTILYTSEKTPLVLVKWQFVLLGKILSIFPLNTGQMYQIAVIILSVCLFACGYFLICLLLEKYEERVLAFTFFVSSTAWPIIGTEHGKLNISYHNYWFNTGNFFVRFGPTPNHQLGRILLICGFILILLWYKNIKSKIGINFFKYNIAFVIIGLGLSSVSPMHWILLLGSLTGMFMILATQVYIREKKLANFLLQHYQPIIFLLLGGLPVVFYIRAVYMIFPYNMTKLWEAMHQESVNFNRLFYGSGILMIFAAIGCYSFFRKKIFSPERVLTLTFVTISLAFFLTDLPWRLGTANIRFWPESIYVFIAVLGSRGVFSLANLVNRAKYFVLIFILSIYFVTTLPTFIAGIKEKSVIDNRNMYYYLPKNIYDVYEFSAKKIKKTSVFLVPGPYDYSFPAFTGQKSFTGDPISHMTINADKKYSIAKDLFNGVLEEKEAQETLVQYGIGYIIIPNKSGVEKYSFLKTIYSNGESAVYKVGK